jgi:hypothetical protein
MHQAPARALYDEEELTPRPRTSRRTVTVTGRPGDRAHLGPRSARVVDLDRRRRRRSSSQELGPRPDRVALWALFMALLLVVVTVLSSHV